MYAKWVAFKCCGDICRHQSRRHEMPGRQQSFKNRMKQNIYPGVKSLPKYLFKRLNNIDARKKQEISTNCAWSNQQLIFCIQCCPGRAPKGSIECRRITHSSLRIIAGKSTRHPCRLASHPAGAVARCAQILPDFAGRVELARQQIANALCGLDFSAVV